MNLENAWVFDTEVYPNCFILVARWLGGEKPVYHKFVVHDSKDNYNLILEWLKTKPVLIGFNNIGFDAPILEYIYRSPVRRSCQDIYDFMQLELFDKRKDNFFYTPFNEWDLTFSHVDMFKINHFENPSKMTSLKWLEFSMRCAKMQDVPFPVGSMITNSSVDRLVAYCKIDVDNTTDFFFRCKSMIQLRQDLMEQYGTPRIMNMSDSSIGEFIFKKSLTSAGIKEKQLKEVIKRDYINIGDCILKYISFRDEGFNNVLQSFKKVVVEDPWNNGLKGIHTQSLVYDDMQFEFGVGGLHACHRPGIYESDEEYVIATVDVKSFYPWLAIANRFYPEHIGEPFCDVYEDLYKERGKFAKGTAMNYALKIALNGVYGKSNSKFSVLYDPMFTLKITINGQLLLTMLAEELSSIGRLLVCNTDGLEVRIPRSKLDEFYEICTEWQNLTGLELEYDFYKKMVIRDVNNYVAVSEKGTIKRKGLFRTYYDFTEEDDKPHTYDKNPSATVIAEALCEFYLNNKPIDEYINGVNNIYPFLYGIKGKKSFDYWLISADENGVIDIEKRPERAIRFFIKKRGANIFKFWKDNRLNNIQSVKKGHLVETALNITHDGEITTTRKIKGETQVQDHYIVDRDFYINQCLDVIQVVESGQFIEKLESDE